MKPAQADSEDNKHQKKELHPRMLCTMERNVTKSPSSKAARDWGTKTAGTNWHGEKRLLK